MLTTIEDKLSAIKAINEEKEFVEDTIRKISLIEATNDKIIPTVKFALLEFGIDGSKEVIVELSVPFQFAYPFLNQIEAWYFNRKEELIEKAKQLMK